MEGIWIYGASGHGRVVIDIAESLGLIVEGIIDDNENIQDIFNYEVVHDNPLGNKLIIGIGDNLTRKKIVNKCSTSTFTKLIHPNTSISLRSKIEEGTVIMPGVTINSLSKIGRHCIINTNSSIDHDCIIEDFVHIGPNVALAGNVLVGEGTQLGIGACVAPGINIGKWCIIGAGAVVIKDIPDYATVVGNPAKIIKFNKLILSNI